MDKPLSLRIEDFERGLVQLINNSGLPVYIIEPLLRASMYEVKTLNITQINNDRQQYLASAEKEATADEQEG